MSNTSVVVLTAEAAQYYADLGDPKVSVADFRRNGYSGDGSPDEVAAFRAIASSRVVCVEAERLARMEAALRFYAAEANWRCGSSERGSPIDFDSGQLAREALAAKE